MKYNFTKLLLNGGDISLGYDFDTFLNNYKERFSYTHGLSATSIPYTPGNSNSLYKSVEDLENSDQYKAFTEYVTNNWDPTTKTFKDARVGEYLRALEDATTGAGHDAILFNGDNLVDNWQDLYRKYRTDKKWGYYHEGPNGPSTPPPPIEPPKIPPPTKIPPKFPPLTPPKKLPWTDWAPYSAQLGLGLGEADTLAEYEKKKKMPLMEGPFLQHKVTNNYHLRSGMEQNANELRDLGAARATSSDLRTNLDTLGQYDAKAADIKNAAEQLKANTVQDELLKLENTVNTNKQTFAEVNNFNMKSNAAAYNNILDANKERTLRRTKLFNDYIDKMYASHGQWLLDNRLNRRYWQRGVNRLLSNLDAQTLRNEFLKKSDFQNSRAYSDFASAVANSKGNQITDFNSTRYNTDRDQYLRELWQSSDFASPYRSQWEKEYNNYYYDYLSRAQGIENNFQASDLLLPQLINNQGWSLENSNLKPTYWPVSYKQGGKTRARLIDYYKYIQKQQLEDKKAVQKSVLERSKLLLSDLDRLSKEQLILLRSIFK